MIVQRAEKLAQAEIKKYSSLNLKIFSKKLLMEANLNLRISKLPFPYIYYHFRTNESLEKQFIESLALGDIIKVRETLENEFHYINIVRVKVPLLEPSRLKEYQPS